MNGEAKAISKLVHSCRLRRERSVEQLNQYFEPGYGLQMNSNHREATQDPP